ncbi:2-dehydropantoate 2-reductase [Nocardia cyriacigeorgica]|uniref:ketopantoate reductase family protein n=1 Tax=Nocardia cyriacigeorgica TaxID=135487 RepID=UPI001892D796|nr:2-dehydropantoate 2-reductase [Nocardia cyriacigeorgica]MBF6397887.1 2-dehydropantoate 2-reductase [Nocardia cyriacigeorgica]MBF6402456.1 2-dehydropantoate 2-reductase [Nocardia cyriacigeorgica]
MAHIVVIGAGSVGGLFAALLAQHGHAVTVLARGQALHAIDRLGLRVSEPHRELHVATGIHAVPALDDVQLADIVLVCVKSWQVDDAAIQAAPVIAGHTVVVPVQNGVDAGDRLAARLSRSHTVGGVCTVFAERLGPASFARHGEPPSLVIGRLAHAESGSDRIAEAAAMLTQAGIRTQVSPDIRRDLWRKLMFIASFGGVAALADATAGAIRSRTHTRALFHSALCEVATVAHASSVEVDDDDVADALAKLDACEPGSTASMMRDLAAGKPSELFDQTGAVVRNGERLGVPTPTHTMIYNTLLPRELANRSSAWRSSPPDDENLDSLGDQGHYGPKPGVESA